MKWVWSGLVSGVFFIVGFVLGTVIGATYLFLSVTW